MAELSSQSTSIQTLYAMFSEEKLFVNRRYQRKLVWTLLEKQKLIESIQKRYPIPAILLAEREEQPGTYEIIDGLQRLHAIISFIETSFPNISGNVFDIEYFSTAKRIANEGVFVPSESLKKLTPKEVGDVLNYNLATSYMRGASEQEINDVFDRINTYGHRLSDQERRQAGVQNEFSNMIRQVACTLRGDESSEVLALRKMPSISIDLPMTKHGYEVRAEQVFWVEHGILRATDLRDSMDEQCIADIAACVIGGNLIDRSKDALDEIYSEGNPEEGRISTALTVYGADRFADEFKFCIDEILRACVDGEAKKLREILFKKSQTNAFPSVFAVIFIAFHELIVGEKLIVTDYSALKNSLKNIADRIDTGRKATGPEERRKNIDSVKGLIRASFIAATVPPKIYSNHSSSDIDAAIRRSEVELADYELKQGMLTLGEKRGIDSNIVEKILKTICAIANNGPSRPGRIILGVTDKDADAVRIEKLDGIKARAVGKRKVVGVVREAKYLGITIEQYLAKWKDAIKQSGLSAPLRDSVLSSIDFNSYFGLGVIVIVIPAQKDLSHFNEEIYWRNCDSTERVTKPLDIVTLANRYK